MDDPAFGPLNDGILRMQFWRAMGHTGPIEETTPDDMYQSWKTLQEEIIKSKVKQIILWIGETGSDYVFERMACYWLSNNLVQLFKVSVPPANGIYATAGFTPEKLSSLFPFVKLITTTQCRELSAAYARIAVNNSMLRELDSAGNLHFLDLSAHDELLLSNITENWQSGAKVVGKAMADADSRNPLGDAFLVSRLQYLIQKNVIEGTALFAPLRLLKVRRKKR